MTTDSLVSNAAFPLALASSPTLVATTPAEANPTEPTALAAGVTQQSARSSRPAASAVGSQQQPNAAEQLLDSTLQRLMLDYDALAVTHWFVKEDGKFSDTILCGDVAPEIQAKTAALAIQAISAAEVQTQLLSSRFQQFLVAVPLPCTNCAAITVLFRHSGSGSTSQSIESRTREVTLAAAHLALARVHANSSSGGAKTGATSPSDPTPQTAPARTSRWRQLRHLVTDNAHNPWLYAAVGIAVLLIGLVPWKYAVKCGVTCEPANRRFVAAPFDGKLLKSHVAPGDRVEQGQVLAVLDGGDLHSQLASLRSKLDQAVQRRSAALSSGDGSKAELERLEVQYLDSEIRLLDDRKLNLEIRSPIAGVVISGDLERAEGVPLSVGENLFEIAPLDQLVAEIAIPEADVLSINAGMTTTITLDATPGVRHQAILTRIHPRNEIRDSASVFIAEALIENVNSTLRPGMKGTASIDAGRRPVAWLLFHRPYEALRGLIGW